MNLFNWVKKEDINFQSDNENLRGNFLHKPTQNRQQRSLLFITSFN